MKPIRTWIVTANARQARFLEHRGAGHGVQQLPNKVFHADPPVDYADKAGVGHSIAGPSLNAVDQGDVQMQADLAFAKMLDQELAHALGNRDFDRFVVFAGPHMLGLLRKVRQPALAEVLLSEVDKDLTRLPADDIEKHLEDVLLV